MFIVVRCGADEEVLFNPDCAIKVLMSDIRKRCSCHCNIESICLFDEKNKSIVKIPDGPNSMDDAACYFTDRGSYIILKVQKEGDIIRYKPLLEEPGKELSNVIESLTTGTLGKPVKSSHSRKTSNRTPQPTAAKQSSGGRSRRK